MATSSTADAQQGWMIRKGLLGFRATPFTVAVNAGGCSVGVRSGCGNGSTEAYAAFNDLQRQVQELQFLVLKENITQAIENGLQGHVDEYHGSSQAQQAMMQMYMQQQMMQQAIQAARDNAAAGAAYAPATAPSQGVVYQRYRRPGVSVQVVPRSYPRTIVYRR